MSLTEAIIIFVGLLMVGVILGFFHSLKTIDTHYEEKSRPLKERAKRLGYYDELFGDDNE